MDSILLILLVLAAIKFVIFGFVLYRVFRQDIRHWWSHERKQKTPTQPDCMYCQSVWTQRLDEGSTRWDGDDLILVTTYQCRHCGLPFWHVERVPMSIGQR